MLHQVQESPLGSKNCLKVSEFVDQSQAHKLYTKYYFWKMGALDNFHLYKIVICLSKQQSQSSLHSFKFGRIGFNPVPTIRG